MAQEENYREGLILARQSTFVVAEGWPKKKTPLKRLQRSETYTLEADPLNNTFVIPLEKTVLEDEEPQDGEFQDLISKPVSSFEGLDWDVECDQLEDPSTWGIEKIREDEEPKLEVTKRGLFPGRRRFKVPLPILLNFARSKASATERGRLTPEAATEDGETAFVFPKAVKVATRSVQCQTEEEYSKKEVLRLQEILLKKTFEYGSKKAVVVENSQAIEELCKKKNKLQEMFDESSLGEFMIHQPPTLDQIKSALHEKTSSLARRAVFLREEVKLMNLRIDCVVCDGPVYHLKDQGLDRTFTIFCDD